MENHDKDFPYTRVHVREKKPRKLGLTEIRGPYYTVMGLNYLEDILSTMGEYIDSLKFAGGSFTLLPRHQLRQIIDLCHEYHVEVSTGGFIEHVLTQGPSVVDRYIRDCREVGFDILEVSAGFISISMEDWLRVVEKVRRSGLKPKPEVGIQFGAGGGTPESKMEAVQDPQWAVAKIKRFLDAGAEIIMIESEGITENVTTWRTDVPAQILRAVGLDKVMFEASDPQVFGWYIKNYGPNVNLFVDHSQIVQLESLRAGIWGTQDVWGRIVTYPPIESPSDRKKPTEKAQQATLKDNRKESHRATRDRRGRNRDQNRGGWAEELA